MGGWGEGVERESRGGNGAAVRCQEEACVTFSKLYFSPGCVSVSLLEPLLQRLAVRTRVEGWRDGGWRLVENRGAHLRVEDSTSALQPSIDGLDPSVRGFERAFCSWICAHPVVTRGSTQTSSSVRMLVEDTRLQGALATLFLFYCKL